MQRAVFALSILGLGSSCNGTTGYDLVDFYAAAAGPPDAVAGQPYAFTNDHGFAVTLARAVLHVGAIYLDQSVPTSGQQQEPCVLPGTYVGEVRGGGDFDMLSPSPQLFPVAGDGSTIPATTAEVWLTHGDVFASADPLPVLTLDGVATKVGSAPIHFQAGITIDSNRSPAPSNTALPGENPICLERIVTPILVDITLAQAGTLILDLDPRLLFVNVDFSAFLSCASCQITADDGSITYLFTNDTTNQPSINLYKNLTAAGPVYRFEWQPSAR
jgi:hypothetical protein